MYQFHRRGIQLDGARPTMLSGYGGLYAGVAPFYYPPAVLWPEAGGVFASANLRGGGEFERQWHDAGRLENKQNVFDDFIAAAEWLPNGLPITLEFGSSVAAKLEAFSVHRAGKPETALEACGFDADGYVNPDLAQQARGDPFSMASEWLSCFRVSRSKKVPHTM